ncbi:hypothetical protein [Halosegnis marinus]|uniref:Uncharacterized protein n=1 Tax=Halosegnis marinus TaxID=3034023 RepID=A0ABD5ZLL7_9EURY|nr:hypothetical protein [Halosegnis sp. DT85]
MTEDNSADGTHTVAQGDVEVTRRLETDGRALIGHVQLRSTAGGPTVVELVDPVPDDVTVESAAFDPDAGPDDGTAGTESIRVEHEVGEDTARVVYGLMLAEPADTAGFEPPRVVRTRPVEPPVTDGGATDGDGTATLSLGDDGTGEGGTGPDDDTGGEGPDADGGGTSDDGSEGPPATGPTIDADLPAGDDSDPETGESGSDDTDPATADDGAAGEASRSVSVRVDRLSARVEEFAAYAEAMESFIDERGTAGEFAARVEGRVDDAEADVATLRETLEAETTALREDVAAMETEVADLRAETEEMRAEVSSLGDEVAEMRELRETLATAFDG